MRRLVEGLLYLSKIESGQIPMKSLPVDLKALIAACVRRIEAQAMQVGIRVQVRMDRLPLILGDADKLEQVFMNLLDNALKYSPAGGVVTVMGGVATDVSIASPKREGRPPRVRISIHNTGSLIAEHDVERIFERFYRLDKSRARSVEGSGLGLAIVKEIVQAHGGSVEARSSAESGTEFLVLLPLESLVA